MTTLRSITLAILTAASFGLVGCEDPVPTDYTEEVVLEGFVIVGEPLNNIRVFRSLPITDTFKIENASVKDAVFTVKADGTELPIEFVDDSLGGTYRAIDTAYRALPGVTYTVEMRARGKVITGSTKTPPLFSWVRTPADTFQYPGINNELIRDPALDIYWTAVPGVTQYIISMEAVDTLGYGVYLTPPTSDTNRRVRTEDRFDDGTLITSERTRYGFALQPSTPVVWSIFKWFGKQEIQILAPDKAFADWFRMVGFGRRSQYDYRLSSVKGGLGTWGSASTIKWSSFLKKDKP